MIFFSTVPIITALGMQLPHTATELLRLSTSTNKRRN